MKKYTKWFYLTLIIFSINSCIEPIDFKPESSERHLVVRSVLTDELRKHSIELSRTISIDSTEINPEKNALVSITDSNGTVYNFEEEEPGIYTSILNFSAEEGKSYSLKIQTSDGKSYSSKPQSLPSSSEIAEINTSIEENLDSDFPDLVFKVNSSPLSEEGKYYRYEYDETFKVISNFWNPQKIEIISDTPPYEFELVYKNPEIDGTGICYVNNSSSNIILTETKTLSEDKVLNFPVCKIPLNSYRIGIRYSILVKQYVLNEESYDFYSLLNKFSDPDDVFTQIQVGNIPSNISSDNNPDLNKVMGFFEVSSVSTKRIFINRDEITTTGYKNYTDGYNCSLTLNPFILDTDGSSPLLELLRSGWVYLGVPEGDPPIIPPNHPYIVIKETCGDCKHLGSISPPDFWVE
ncbi:uncharacterized protein DUF4249 [Tenacibaculum lutimaris]|uniref:Uncharacterized protein DUF4249 n=1 Tax=Tenacibaculum lutimaris TaxID=285258 RepID=A0A420E0F9_9FLAO|nr:DUF4249 domain-containing protein [Tenacibaculum lutimaris]RKF03559.1 uncharacterized protein DUF4249 [Tenacibaculum lutimaris]